MSAQPVPFDQKLAMAAVAGVSGTSMVYPLDIIKTQLQTSPTNNTGFFNSVRMAARNIISTGGIRGLWRGFVAAAVGIAPEKGTKLAVNDYMREYFTSRHPGKYLNMKEEIMAGSVAGTVQLAITVPYEHIKIKLQISNGLSVSQIVKQIGFRNLYRGLTATFIRDVPFCFIYFPLYSNLKALQMSFYTRKEEPFHVGLVAGMISGMTAGVITTPGDLIKTRLQRGTGGITTYQMFHKTVQTEGWKSLFRGWNTRVLIIGPNYAFISAMFELQKRYLV
mmetsp:Transcript_34279/g.34946  ORF Transcript_34279/g.34946 Transcript_34279/m.34946 type:complete len:278 (-) Transcript_34279:315-1148(-)|eukprot:CAMPEP_0182427954 /NCGR_PEP_ID=MMETSP1167-20130531/20914_1 /TAXON_ID=2988 /ORGANISM="Mallomonas Sp, Strain CCMP3275" /LENGTH=277 /DNA_ID=CAMNT_0024610561 /DNA_START=157 /DNA_END=990 /DNA_ORIENTATION=-